MATYDLSTLYTALPNNLIKEKLTEFIEQTFKIDGSLYLTCKEKRAFSFLNNLKDINCGHVRKSVTLSFIFWTTFLKKNLVQNCKDKLYVFLWVLIVLLLLQICI